MQIPRMLTTQDGLTGGGGGGFVGGGGGVGVLGGGTGVLGGGGGEEERPGAVRPGALGWCPGPGLFGPAVSGGDPPDGNAVPPGEPPEPLPPGVDPGPLVAGDGWAFVPSCCRSRVISCWAWRSCLLVCTSCWLVSLSWETTLRSWAQEGASSTSSVGAAPHGRDWIRAACAVVWRFTATRKASATNAAMRENAEVGRSARRSTMTLGSGRCRFLINLRGLVTALGPLCGPYGLVQTPSCPRLPPRRCGDDAHPNGQRDRAPRDATAQVG